MPLVSECIVIQKEDKLIALVYPDFDEAKNLGLNNEDLEKVMEQNRVELNNEQPAYCKITQIKLHEEEFAKTPKKSIKRYLYQDA